LNVGQSYHSVNHFGNIIPPTFQQVIHLVKNSIFFSSIYTLIAGINNL
jgi:hypothetical protein